VGRPTLCVWCGVVWCGAWCVVCGVWCVVSGVWCGVVGGSLGSALAWQNAQTFDSSRSRGRPFSFEIGIGQVWQVVKGGCVWGEAGRVAGSTPSHPGPPSCQKPRSQSLGRGGDGTQPPAFGWTVSR
jgi:hypothetical protein